MDHKKIPLGPDDIKKLKALLKEQEKLVDAMSDDELAQAERDVELRIKKLPQMSTKTSRESEQDVDEAWKRLEQRMNAQNQNAKVETPLNVIPLQQKKKSLPWATLSVLAAAALALLIFYPSLRQNQRTEPGDLSQMQTKGNEGRVSGDCEIEFVGAGEPISEGAFAGQGYLADARGSFPLKVFCQESGYLQVVNANDPQSAILNAKIEKAQAALPHRGDDVASFGLSGQATASILLVLTDSPVTSIDEVVNAMSMNSKEAPKTVGAAKILWSDRVILQEKK